MRIKQPQKSHINKILLVFILFLISILSFQTKILSDLNHNDQEQLFLAKQLSNIIKTQRRLYNQTFTCLTIFPFNLTKNIKEKVHKLNISYDFDSTTNIKQQGNQKDQNLQNNQQNNQQSKTNGDKKIVGFYQDYDYDKILDLLHGQCAVHQTQSFLYEYCHKQKVRQFDSLQTKQRMAKAQFEDIAMGFYDYQKVIQNSKADIDQALRTKSKNFKVKYDQKGQLKVLDQFLSQIPELSEQQRKLLKSTIASQMGIQTNGPSATATRATGQNGKQQIKVTYQSVPVRSVIYNKNNLFTVDMMQHKEFQFDKENKIIHSNYPMTKNNDYYLQAQNIYQVTCQYHVNGILTVYVSKGSMISPYELLFHGNSSKCEKIIAVSYAPITLRPYNTPFYTKKIRANQNYLYGQIQQACTNNWDWSMDSEGDDFATNRRNSIEIGSVLMVSVTLNVSGTLKTGHHSLNVKQIIAPQVIKVQQNVGQFLNISSDKRISQAWISGCRIISQKPIDKQSFMNKNGIINKKLILVKQDGTKPKQAGDQMLCLCRYQKYIQEYLQMNIVLGKKVFQVNKLSDYIQYDAYYEYYMKNTVKTYSQEGNLLSNLCTSFICYDIKKDEQKLTQTSQNSENKQQQNTNTNTQKQQTNAPKQITSLYRLTNKNPVLSQIFQSQDKILIIDIQEGGMIKIHTVSNQSDQKYYYIVTDSSLFKVKVYPNNTKQIINQNSFYQNKTLIGKYNYFLYTTLVVYKNYMWRGSDKIIFPRMNFENERITSIQRVSGVSYIRTWNMENMRFKKQSYYLTKIDEYINEHFRVKKYPIYQEQKATQNPVQAENDEEPVPQNQQQPIEEPIQQNLQQPKQTIDYSKIDFTKTQFKPLNKSVTLRYQYFHGQFCGQPINKNRRTDVYLQCGQPWLKIQQVKQTSPCVYELRVSTKLLCRSDYYKVVQKISKVAKRQQSKIQISKSVVCYPKNSWDNVQFAYDLDTKDILYEGN